MNSRLMLVGLAPIARAVWRRLPIRPIFLRDVGRWLFPNSIDIGHSSLAGWLIAFSRSAKYRALTERFSHIEGAITSADEVAMLYALIQHLRPRMTVEIGTFFARTTRIMAEAIQDGSVDGTIVTIDPFGAERVPSILLGWPNGLQRLVQFYPMNSMDYFVDLETRSIARDSDQAPGLVFVDGHHSFEYALFDIIRSADHLRPGGAIVVDNMEQDGPKLAAVQFLKWNPAWQLFLHRDIVPAYQLETAVLNQAEWGVLVAPEGLQVAGNPVKLVKRGIPYIRLAGLTVNISAASRAGTLHFSLSYYAVPYDYHVTGLGMSHARSSGKIAVRESGTTASFTFEHPIDLQIDRPDQINVCYEIELYYRGNRADAWILLDATSPVIFESKPVSGY